MTQLDPSLIMQKNQGIDPSALFEQRAQVQLRNLALQRQARDDQSATEQQALLKNVGGLAASGDYAGADKAALGAGNFDLHQHISGLQTEQRAQLADKWKAIAGVAYQSQDLPYEQRKAAIASALPALAAHGVTADDIAQFDPTDANIQGAIGTFRSIDDAVKAHEKQNEPYTLSQGDVRFVGGKQIASVAPKPEYVTTPEGSFSTLVNGGSGASSVGTGSIPFENLINAESGGRHFAKGGSPLTSPAGAVGIAQIMPGTGPEAAAAAGVKWDATRFRQDPAYNRALGAAYYQSLQQKYGNDALAAAAYNAGPGRVDKALAAGGPQGWINHVPAETRNYVAKVSGGSGSGGPPAVIRGAPKTPSVPTGYQIGADGNLRPWKGGPADGAVFDHETTALMADQYLSGDKSVLQNLGRGNQGAKNMVELRSEIYRQAQERGMSGKDIAATMARFNGMAAQARAVGTISGKVDYGVNELSASIPLAQKASTSLPRGSFVPLTQAEQLIQRGSSDPRLKDFAIKTNAVINAYNLVAGRAGTSVEQRKHNAELLRTADSPAAYQAALAAMKMEGDVAKQASGKTMDDVGRPMPKPRQSRPTVSNW